MHSAGFEWRAISGIGSRKTKPCAAKFATSYCIERVILEIALSSSLVIGVSERQEQSRTKRSFYAPATTSKKKTPASSDVGAHLLGYTVVIPAVAEKKVGSSFLTSEWKE